MHSLTRRLVAELFGTFMLVFFGAGAVMTTNFPKADFGLLGIALAHGLAFAIGISATMAISGGHLNPAITAGMLAIKRIDAKSAGLLTMTDARWKATVDFLRSANLAKAGTDYTKAWTLDVVTNVRVLP